MPHSSWGAFHERALRIYQDFLAEGPRRDADAYVDPDPASTIGPSNPTANAVTQRACELGEFAGLEVDGSVLRVGFTHHAPSKLQTLLDEFPDVDVQLYPARHSEIELARVQDEISTLMSASNDMSILSCGVEIARNVVTVGVNDIKSPQAAALRARFGDAVEIFADEPIELLRSRMARD